MSYLFGMIVLVVGAILKRYAVPALIGTIVVSAVVGGICTLSGGQFWDAAKYTAEACAGISVLAVIVTTFSAFSRF